MCSSPGSVEPPHAMLSDHFYKVTFADYFTYLTQHSVTRVHFDSDEEIGNGIVGLRM